MAKSNRRDSSTFSMGDFVDLPSLATKLKQPADPVSAYLKGNFSAATLTVLADYQGPSSDPGPLRAALVADLNAIIGSQPIYDTQRFAGIALRPVTQQLLAQNPQGDVLARVNRLLLEDTYPLEISRNHKKFIPTRASLLIRLKDWRDDESWRDFYETYCRLIYGAALKAGLNEAEAEDVVQETVVVVTKKIKEFKYDPALGFKNWLLKITQWRVADQFRKRLPKHEAACSDGGGEGTNPIEEVPDQASAELLNGIWEEEWQHNLLERAIEEVKKQVEARTYQMFQLYVRQEWPPKKVAAALGVSCNQVYVAKNRVTDLLEKEIRRLQEKDPLA